MNKPEYIEVNVNGGKAYIRVKDISYLGYRSENKSYAVVGGVMLVISESIDDLMAKIK